MTNKALAPLPEYVSQDSNFDNLQRKDDTKKSKYISPALAIHGTWPNLWHLKFWP